MSDVQTDPQIIENPAPVAVDPAPAEPVEAPKPDTSWVPRRISEITAARRAAEARAAELERENADLRARMQQQPSADGMPTPAPPPGQSVDQLAKAYAERMVREQRDQETMSQRIGDINSAGTKEYGDEFDKSVNNLQMAGVGGPDFLRVLTNIPKPEAVVTWLGKAENLNEAMRMATLDPVQMGIELTKLSSKAAKELGKQISKAPPPIQTVDGRSGAADGVEPDPSDTQAWIAWRSKNKKSRR